MRNSFQIDKVRWMQHPILNLLIYSVSNVTVEKSSFILDLVTLTSAQYLCMTITKSNSDRRVAQIYMYRGKTQTDIL